MNVGPPTRVLRARDVTVRPTRAGVMLGLMLGVLLVGSINYQLGLGYLLTFLLAGCALAAAVQTHATLRDWMPGSLSVGGAVTVSLATPVAAPDSGRPGWPASGRSQFALRTRSPLGLFEARALWTAPDRQPGPAHSRAGRPATDTAEPFNGLRPWRPGDALHQVAWRKSAQAHTLLSRERSHGIRPEAAPAPAEPEAAPPRPIPARLPREARDTLFLLAVIAWIAVPLLPQRPLWCSALVAGVLAWRGWRAIKGTPLPGLPWRLALLALVLAATLVTHHTLVGREAGMTLIVALLALKTLELRARRDAFVLFFLGLFALLTQFFTSQSPATAVGVVLGLLGLLTALVLAHPPVDRPSLAQAGGTALRLLVAGLPVALVLFLLFPRWPPLWGLAGESLAGRTGLAAQMAVGDVARLARDDAPALDLTFDGPVPPRALLYFRGPVLANFDGRTWHPLYPHAVTLPEPSVAARRAPLLAHGPAVRYTLTQAPSHHPWLPLLETSLLPPQPLDPDARAPWSDGLQRTPEAHWVMARPATDVIRLRAQSHPAARLGPIDRLEALPLEYRELPAGFNPRTLQLATDLMKASPAPPEDKAILVDMALQRLRDGDYHYTLAPGAFGTHSADEFWFDRRAGFCEHIASAFTILMRGMDIPARIVTGYQGGEPGDAPGRWRVRHSDAHAWVEVWLQGRGWVRVDPTAVVAPGRTEAAQRPAAPHGLWSRVVTAIHPGLHERWHGLRQAIDTPWREQVTDYTRSRQQALLAPILGPRPSTAGLMGLLGAALAACALSAVLAAIWRPTLRRGWAWLRERVQRGIYPAGAARPRAPRGHDAVAARLLRATGRRLQRHGLTLPASATPRQMAQAALERFGRAATPLADWLGRLEALRYGPPPGPAPATNSRSLARQWRQLSWPC